MRETIQARSASEWFCTRFRNHSLALRACIRFAIALVISAVSFGSLKAQDATEPKRFKHEKHGAIVFAKGDDYEVKCDIYQPKSDEPRPVMLAIHGGAWTTGTKFAMLRHARILANRGYVVMSINYRLAPDHKWPAQIHDCKHAVRWIREHADKYNADPDRVYAYGYSAGGHLAALLATTDKDDGLEGELNEPYSKHSSRIQGLIAGGAPMEFSWIEEDSTTLKHWLGGTKETNPEKYKQASATTYVTADDPVAVLYHGKVDNLVPTSSPQSFFDCCQKANIDSSITIANGGHASAFTQTTLLIESLQKLEAMLAKKKCQAKIDRMAGWVESYKTATGRAPDNLTQVLNFAGRSEALLLDELLDAAFSDRDGKEFEVQWDAKGRPVVSEAVGVDGEKLSSAKR